MDYPYNYQNQQEYGSYQQSHSAFISDTTSPSINTTYINNQQINLSNNNSLNPSLMTNMTMNNNMNPNGYPFQSNQLIEQQIPPRMASINNINNININLLIHPNHQHAQMNMIHHHHIQPYHIHYNHNRPNHGHNNRKYVNYGRGTNGNGGGYNNHNRRRRHQRQGGHGNGHGHGHGHNHNHHHHSNHNNNNNAANPRGFQPKDAEFPWHLPPRLQRARAQKKAKKKMKQQRKQMQQQQYYEQYQVRHGPLYIHDTSIPPPPNRPPPNPPTHDHVPLNVNTSSSSRDRDNEQYPPLPDIKCKSNEGEGVTVRSNEKSTSNGTSTRKRRRRGRHKNQSSSGVNNDGQKGNNGDVLNAHQVQTQQVPDNLNCNTNVSDRNTGDYAFMHQFVNGIGDDDNNGDDPIINLNFDAMSIMDDKYKFNERIELGLGIGMGMGMNSDSHFKSMEQEIVDNVLLLQHNHENDNENGEDNDNEQSVITNDNISQYSSTYGSHNTENTTTTYDNNGVSVTIGELFGDISCSSSYTKSNTNSPNPKKNKLYNNHNDIVSLSKIEW
mmetsp:Transcript_46585/g.41650  ORF Transcript_46585/g.41650 Transcript_46585/m.41650 type:complete len:553 (+) Transcript_46585:72-1730(+)